MSARTPSIKATRRVAVSATCAAAIALVLLLPGAAAGQVGASADLALTKSASPEPVRAGNTLTYTLSVRNNGPDVAESVRVTDQFPDGVDLLDSGDCGSLSEGEMKCDYGDIAANTTETATFTVTPNTVGEVDNFARVASDFTFDPSLENNASGTSSTVQSAVTHPLTVQSGSGGVVTSAPAGINCPTDCSEDYSEDDIVVLTATPTVTGGAFVSWGGDCAGTTSNKCALTMDAARTASATFRGPLDPSSPARASFVTSSSGPAKGLVTLNSSATTNATKLQWAISGPGAGALKQFETAATSAFTTMRINKPGSYTVSMTATGPGGSTTATQPLTVSKSPKLNSAIPNVAVAGPSALSAGHSQVCMPNSQVVFGTLDARGCFYNVGSSTNLPPNERKVAGARFDAQLGNTNCGFIQLGNPPCYRTADLLGVVYSKDPVKFNGMTLTPAKGAAVVLFPGTGDVISSDAKLTLSGGGVGPITAHNGKLDLWVGSGDLGSLTDATFRTRLFTFNGNQLPSIGGFSLDGETSLSLVSKGPRRYTELATSLTLPEAFSTAANTRPSGRVSIAADNDRGLILDQLFISVPEAFLGGVRLTDLSFTYKDAGEPDASPACASKWWKATAKVYLVPSGDQRGAGLDLVPPPTREGVAFCDGGFHSAGGNITFGEPIPPPQIFPGVFLDNIGFNMALNPTVMSGDATVTAAKIVRATGGLLVAFASPRAPYVIRAEDAGNTLGGLAGTRLDSTSFALGGSVGMALPTGDTLNLANGYFLYAYPNYIKAAAGARLNTFLFVIEANALLEMNLKTRRYDAGLNGNLCIAAGISIAGHRGCIGGFARVADRGMIGCLILVDDGLEPGIGYHWGDALPHIFNGITDGCKPSQYWSLNIRSAQIAARRAMGAPADDETVDRAAEPLAFTLKPGDEAKDIELHGVGGAPAVTVTAPDGETITTVPNEMQLGDKLQTLAWEQYDYTWVGVAHGQPGTYTVTPLEGSVPIEKMLETRSIGNGDPTGSVTGKGRNRVLHYNVGTEPSQEVTFWERGETVNEQLGTAKRGKGTVKFAPAPGAPGQRQIVAEYTVDGIPAPNVVLDTYTAPPPERAGRVKRVKVKRRGSALEVTWGKAKGAVAYAAVLQRKDGVEKTIEVGKGRQRARFAHVPQTEGGTVAVSAIGPLGDHGRRGAGSFKATKKKTDRRLPFK